MNTLARAALDVALERLDRAVRLLEDANTYATPALVGEAFAHVLAVRGELVAIAQLEDLEAELAAADTERPQLRVVR